MSIGETRDNHRRTGVAVKEAKISGLNKEIAEIKETQMRIEDKIYMVSLENK